MKQPLSFIRLWLLLILLLCVFHALVQYAEAATTREYYITAEEIDWDYAPMRWDNYRDQALDLEPSALYTVHNATRIGSVYRKAVFRQYTTADFSIPIAHDPGLGTIGPIVRAEVGDQIKILFWNRATKPLSLHPHTANLSSTAVPGTAVQPGDTFTYIWDIPTTATFNNVSSILWTYTSQADAYRDLNAGLLGPIVIYPSGTLKRPSPGSTFDAPVGIDQEVFTIMMTTDEGQSKYFVESAKAAGLGAKDIEHLVDTDPLFIESNRMYHVNGYVYNNNADLRVVYNTSVRWYVISFGLGDDDVHTAHWHGSTLLRHGHRVDVVDLMPISFEILDLVPDSEGPWLFHCHVAAHLDAGMSAFYQVDKPIYTGDEGWG